MKRTTIRRKARTKGGRGSLPDKIRWMHDTGRCEVSGEWPVEIHHVRKFGSRATDEKVIPLRTRYHREGPQSIHVLGWRKFEQVHGIDLDAACAKWQAAWEAIDTDGF